MRSAENAFVLVSYIAEQMPDLEKWLVYHLSLGIDQIVVYQPPRMFKQPSDMATFEKAGRVQRRPLNIDVGAPLKSAIVSAMSEGILPGDTLAVALNVGEYLSIGAQFKPIQQEISADFAAWVMPVVELQEASVLEVGEQENVEFRTIFRVGAFRSHSGEIPIGVADEANYIWLNGAGHKIDPDRAVWEGAPEADDETSGVVIKLSAVVDSLLLDEGSRGSSVMAYANKQIALGPLTEEQLSTLGLSGDTRETFPEYLPEIRLRSDGTDTTPAIEGNDADAQRCPDWYNEIRPGGTANGFFEKLEHHSLVYVQRPSDTLVVTFDNLSAVNNLSFQRAPWAYKILRQEGCAHLGVLAHRKDWFRNPKLIAAMAAKRDEGVFRAYKKVIFSGTSMGGFAALAFSSLSPGARVLAFSPQSTLDEDIVPWETRFGMGRLRNWRLPFSDAAFEIEEAEQIVVISDPYFELDQRHVDRLTTPNVVKLKAWFSGHFSPVFLNRADLLKPIMTEMIRSTLTEDAYYRLYRGRRELPWYKRSLEEALIQKGHKKLASRVGPAFKRAKNETKQLRQPTRSENMSDEIVYELNGVRLPHDDTIITPQVSAALKRGNYERPEVLATPKFLEPQDRVLELGAGIGYISSYVAKVIGVAHVTCVEANPKLANYIRRMHDMQGLSNTTIRNCVAVSGSTKLEPKKEIDFYIREPFWSSSLDPGREVVSVAQVPQAFLSDLISETGATAMIVDIEGGERDIFQGGDLGTVRKIYVELHTRYIRGKGIKTCFDALSEHGFYYDQRVSHGGVVLFRKL